MIDKNDILKMVQHVLKRSRGIPDKRLLHPVREWLIGLLGTVTVIVVGVIYAVNLFTSFSTVSDIEQTGSAISIRYNESVVEEARVLYGARENRFNELRGRQVTAPDQSTEVVEEDVAESETADVASEETDGGAEAVVESVAEPVTPPVNDENESDVVEPVSEENVEAVSTQESESDSRERTREDQSNETESGGPQLFAE